MGYPVLHTLEPALLVSAFINVLPVLHREGSQSAIAPELQRSFVTWLSNDPDIKNTPMDWLSASRLSSRQAKSRTHSCYSISKVSRTTVKSPYNCLVRQMDFQNICSILGLPRIGGQIIVSQRKDGRFRSWEEDLVGLGRGRNGEVACSS